MKKISLPLILTLMLVMTSCSTVFDPFGTAESGLPSWTVQPRVKKDHIAYVSKGRGGSGDEARLDAMKNLLLEMSSDLGWDSYTVYYRELTTTDGISDFDGKVEKVHTREDDGVWTSWILFQADAGLLDSMRTVAQKEFFEREELISGLIEEASENYRENRDVVALDRILDALLLSLSGDDEELTADLLDIALRYLEPLEFRVEQKGVTADSGIRVIRDKGLFSPKVKDAPVVFYYERETTTGGRERDSVTVTSGESGTYSFVNTDPYIRRIGEVTVSLALNYDKLYEIDEKAGYGFFRPFWDMLGTKTLSYPYDIRETGTVRKDLEAVMTEYDVTGRERLEADALGSFAESVGDDHIGIKVSRGRGEDDEAIYGNFIETHPDHERYIAVIRLGIVENVDVLGKKASHSEGSINIIDGLTGKSVLYDDTLQAIGYGDTREEAEDDALRAGGRIALSVLMLEFLE